MKKFLLVVTLWLAGISLMAEPIPLDKARQIASSYWQVVSSNPSAKQMSQNITLAYQATSKANTDNSTNTKQLPVTYFYVFNVGQDDGMVIVAGDNKVLPILGYSETGSYEHEKLPPHFIKWLESYKSQIRYAIDNSKESESTLKIWESLESGNLNKLKENQRTQTVGPLLSTKWNQSPFFNDICPYDNQAGGRTVTGCVATAMAQIMKYWNYPEKGSGFHSYNHPKYGTLSANFGGTTYDWASMPNTINSSNTAVATLMYHVGVSVDMEYDLSGNGGSSAYIISVPSKEQSAEYALNTYFGYPNAQGIVQDNYTIAEWSELIIKELDAGQPILYGGFGNGGGHAFVCDGYDGNGYFHMNWGWGGQADGYFAITALNPNDLGTGGGSGGFNSGQLAVIGIKPPADVITYNLKLQQSITTDYSTVGYGQGFTIHTDILNEGNNTFQGDYGAAAFDEEGNFVDFIEVLSDWSLQGGYYYTNGIDFTTNGLLTLLPGNYRIYIFYRPTDGNWQLIEGDLLTNEYLDISVSNNNAIDLYSDMAISQGNELNEGEQVTVNVDIANLSDSTFSGTIDLSFYHLDGSFAFTLESKTNMNLCSQCHFTDGLIFQNNALDIEPGTYLLAIQHQWDGGDWEITGSSSYTNPIKVIVKAAPIQPDPFENNDDIASSQTLPVNFSGNAATIKTTGTNQHVGTDLDFFKIELQPGYDYQIIARVHDSNNAGDGISYSNDVLFSYSTDGQHWSDAFDDILPSAIQLPEGGTVYFQIAPYFQGETGTYLLDVSIDRNIITALPKKRPEIQPITIYPNPSNGAVFIDSKEKILKVIVLDMNGRTLKTISSVNGQKGLDISYLKGGIYLLQIHTRTGVVTKSIIRQ